MSATPPEQRTRMAWRVTAVGLGYVLYLLIQSRSLGAGLLVGIGTIALSWSLVDRWTLRRADRSGLMQVGTTILGAGLISVGLLMLLK